jgi:protein involved in temperature-dependent protein secretion
MSSSAHTDDDRNRATNEVTEEDVKMLEWIRDNSDRLGRIADRMLQSLDEEEISS